MTEYCRWCGMKLKSEGYRNGMLWSTVEENAFGVFFTCGYRNDEDWTAYGHEPWSRALDDEGLPIPPVPGGGP